MTTSATRTFARRRVQLRRGAGPDAGRGLFIGGSFHLTGGPRRGPSRGISQLRDAHGIGVSARLERFRRLAQCVVRAPCCPDVVYRTLPKVTLLLFNSAYRAVREFQPVTPGKVSVYLCGATVQGAPHLGHLRSAVCFDVLVRWLEASGQQVTYCRNVTDIDDKILRAAAAEETPWWALAERYHREFTTAYALVGRRPPDLEPRATGHIPDMTVLIERLLASGHAYATGGDVYFDVQRFPDYGALSRQPSS